MNNLEALYELQKEIIVQYSGEQLEMTADEQKALEVLFGHVNRAIETTEKSENEKLRIASENSKAKKQLVGQIIVGCLGLAGHGLNAAAQMINVGRILHVESLDNILTKTQAWKFVPNRS